MQVPMAQWDQAGGNPAGSGFRAVNTVVPVHPPARYIQLPSDAVTSSPVIGPNATIHVGTQSGTLYVCRPDRDLPRRAPFQGGDADRRVRRTYAGCRGRRQRLLHLHYEAEPSRSPRSAGTDQPHRRRESRRHHSLDARRAAAAGRF
jgi:hypothetical protein